MVTPGVGDAAAAGAGVGAGVGVGVGVADLGPASDPSGVANGEAANDGAGVDAGGAALGGVDATHPPPIRATNARVRLRPAGRIGRLRSGRDSEAQGLPGPTGVVGHEHLARAVLADRDDDALGRRRETEIDERHARGTRDGLPRLAAVV